MMYLQVQIRDLTEVEIVEDPNPQKEPDVIDITNLDDENEKNSAKQDKCDENEKMFFSHKRHKNTMADDSAFQTHETGMRKQEKGIFIGDSAASSHMSSDPTA